MTDFEAKNGKYYPKITGIVILQQDQYLLEDGLYEMDAVSNEKEFEQQQKKIVVRWRNLVRSLLLRHRLKEDYGH